MIACLQPSASVSLSKKSFLWARHRKCVLIISDGGRTSSEMQYLGNKQNLPKHGMSCGWWRAE